VQFATTTHPNDPGIGIRQQVINRIAQGTRAFGVESSVLSLSSDPSPALLELNGYSAHRVNRNNIRQYFRRYRTGGSVLQR
jgi:rhamnosyl/mannosyltransferase